MPRPTATAATQEAAPPHPALAWPGDVPSEVEADGIVCAALAGLKAADDSALDRALAALTRLEQDALDGAALPVDAVPVRRAAALRYRVGVALGTAPAPGGAVDEGALTALLGDVDDVLAAVGAAAKAAPAEAAPALETIRHALVKEAIDLSELAQRIARLPEAPAAMAAAPAPKAPVATARILPTREEEPPPRRPVAIWVVLAAAALLGGAYHAQRLVNAPRPAPAPVPFEAPAGYVVAPGPPGGSVTLVPRDEERDPQAVERFVAEQRAQGRVVRELSGGAMVVSPRRSRGQEEAR